MTSHVKAVRVGFTTYGHIWHDDQRGWVGAKTGEFKTERSGFEGPLSAEAWVLTNNGLHIQPAWGDS